MKYALEVIGKMKPDWAKKALKKKTWSKSAGWFFSGQP